jgi:penicillin-insensitive murein endopeptidase
MRSSRWIFAVFALAFGCAAASPRVALAKPPAVVIKHDKHDKKGEKSAKPSEPKPAKGTFSSGAPNAGKLAGGEKLTSNRSLEVRGGGHAYGLPDLVKVLKRAASKVNRKYKGSVLFVGDLSAKKGGPLLGHNSHQSGRDADVGFYMRHDDKKHVNPHRFVTFASDGRARGGELVLFDDERNWAFVEALLTDTKTEVRYLFVSMGLRARLLKYAASKNVPKDLFTKASVALMSPADADVHDDHFHVRIACPEKMRPECVEDSYLRASAPTAHAASKPAAAPKNASEKAPAAETAKAETNKDADPSSEKPEESAPKAEELP